MTPLDPNSFFLGAIASLVIGLVAQIIFGKSEKPVEKKELERVFLPDVATVEIKRDLVALTKKIESVELMVKQRPVLDENRLIDKLVRSVIYACVTACRSERIRMKPEQIKANRFRWFITANDMAKEVLKNPIEEIQRPGA